MVVPTLQQEPPHPQSKPLHLMLKHVQVLPLQSGVGSTQALPQPPQLPVSFVVLTHVPLHTWYVGAGPHTHDPLEHVVPTWHVPQDTVTPQLFVAVPHTAVPHAIPLSVQPHPLAPAVPPPHVLGGAHVFGQVML